MFSLSIGGFLSTLAAPSSFYADNLEAPGQKPLTSILPGFPPALPSCLPYTRLPTTPPPPGPPPQYCTFLSLLRALLFTWVFSSAVNVLGKPDQHAGRPVLIDYTNFTRPLSSFPCSKTDTETLNRHGNNHPSRGRAHSPRQTGAGPRAGLLQGSGRCLAFKPRARRAPPGPPHPRPKGSRWPAQSRTAVPPSPAPNAHRRRSPSLPAPPLLPSSLRSKPLRPPAGPVRAAARTRRPAPPPALVFKRARRSHWSVQGGARRGATGPRPQVRPTRRPRTPSIGRARTRIRIPAFDWWNSRGCPAF